MPTVFYEVALNRRPSRRYNPEDFMGGMSTDTKVKKLVFMFNFLNILSN
jgi:hypothetical protein